MSLLLAMLAGCVGRGEASVLLSFVDAGAVESLVGVRARLTLTDAEGRHPALTVRGVGADDVGVEGVDVPLPCDGDACRGTIVVDPGAYDVALTLSALDRCAARGDVLVFAGQVTVGHWETVGVDLVPAEAAFDDDGDGIISVLEASGCGRFDAVDDAAPARQCGPGREGCCLEASAVAGGQMRFVGGAVTLPYDRDGVAGNDDVTVAPFALDSTEFTFGSLGRCVAAGACLVGRPDHPARVRLADGVDPRLPVTSLSPADAAVACAWAGRRLPKDAEWYAAAALRGDGTTAAFPFDVDAGVAVGCLAEDPPPAARHRAAGRDCGDGGPLPVGSFLQTLVERGEGTPVADLAGNVAEWTVIGSAGVDDVDGDGIPDGATAIALRGGGAASFVQLLENELVLLFDAGDAADVARLAAATAAAGFRCASDDVVAVVDEPVCPAPDPGAVDAGGSAPGGTGDAPVSGDG